MNYEFKARLAKLQANQENTMRPCLKQSKATMKKIASKTKVLGKYHRDHE